MKKIINIISILILTGISFTNSIAQIQIGQSILGEIEDFSATKVALSADGNRVAIPAIRNDGNGNNSGAVRVFDLINEIWTQVGSNINGMQAEDYFGSAISLSTDGHRLAVGASESEDGGHVRVFEFIDSEWVQIGEKISSETLKGLGFAIALSATGNKIAISAPYTDSQTGSVQVFELVNGIWTKLGEDIVGSNLLEYFGETLSLSADGNRLVIGKRVSPPMKKTGIIAYEFINGTWSQIGDEIENEDENYTLYAKSISLSADGTSLAIGAPNISSPGYAAVYEFDDSEWQQIGTNIYVEGQDSENTFGGSIDISSDGNRIAVTEEVTFDYPGSIRIYELIDDNWAMIGDEIAGKPNCCSGSISLSGDGNTIAIGEDYSNQANLGRVRVFDLQNATVSVQQLSSTQLNVFPNPTTGRIEIQTSMEYTALQIVDQYGRVEMMIDEDQTYIDLNHLASGIYFIRLWSQDQFISQKLVKI